MEVCNIKFINSEVKNCHIGESDKLLSTNGNSLMEVVQGIMQKNHTDESITDQMSNSVIKGDDSVNEVPLCGNNNEDSDGKSVSKDSLDEKVDIYSNPRIDNDLFLNDSIKDGNIKVTNSEDFIASCNSDSCMLSAASGNVIKDLSELENCCEPSSNIKPIKKSEHIYSCNDTGSITVLDYISDFKSKNDVGILKKILYDSNELKTFEQNISRMHAQVGDEITENTVDDHKKLETMAGSNSNASRKRGRDNQSNKADNEEKSYLNQKEKFPEGNQIVNTSALQITDTKKRSLGISGPLLYQCLHCSFTHPKLEILSSHVVSCAKKRKLEQTRTHLKGETPLKLCILPQNHLRSKSNVRTSNTIVSSKTQLKDLQLNPPVPTKIDFARDKEVLISNEQQSFQLKPSLSFVPKVKSFLPSLSVKSSVPVKSALPATKNSQLIITSQNQSVISSQPSPPILSSPTTHVLISPQTQLSGGANTLFTISPQAHCTSSTQAQVVINSPSRLPIVSKSQIVSSPQQRSILQSSSQNSLSSMNGTSTPKAQPVITLQTQLPTKSDTQCSSSCEPQFSMCPESQFHLAAGTTFTLGPRSPVPIIPQPPLTISPQGLTIAQSGTQLLISTNSQQNAATPNQPTLLGLGIGTNPTSVPKNIVLLPNTIINPSSGKVNGKQEYAPFQGQFIIQPAISTPSSVANVPLQHHLIYQPQSLIGQPHVLLSPLHTISNKPVTTSAIITTKPSIQTGITLGNWPSSKSVITMPPASTNNAKTSDQASKKKDLGKYICEICDDYMNDLEKLRSHMQCLHAIVIHPKMMPSFNCQKCRFCFYTEQGLERHLVGSHGLVTTGMQEAADKGKDGGRCPICGWGYQSKLLRHVAADHKITLKPADLTYKCTVCTNTFGMYKQFEEHVYSVHRSAISKLAKGNYQSSLVI